MKDKIKHEEALSLMISENSRLGAELKRTQELLKIISGEHDAVIRQDEREEVLDKLYAFVDNGCNHVECGHQYYVILPELIYILNSLRQPTQKKEGAP